MEAVCAWIAAAKISPAYGVRNVASSTTMRSKVIPLLALAHTDGHKADTRPR